MEEERNEKEKNRRRKEERVLATSGTNRLISSHICETICRPPRASAFFPSLASLLPFSCSLACNPSYLELRFCRRAVGGRSGRGEERQRERGKDPSSREIASRTQRRPSSLWSWLIAFWIGKSWAVTKNAKWHASPSHDLGCWGRWMETLSGSFVFSRMLFFS